MEIAAKKIKFSFKISILKLFNEKIEIFLQKHFPHHVITITYTFSVAAAAAKPFVLLLLTFFNMAKIYIKKFCCLSRQRRSHVS